MWMPENLVCFPKNAVGSRQRILSFDGTHRRSFAVSSGFGFDAEVCCRISYSRVKAFLNRLSLGKFSYVSIAVSSLLLH